MWDNGVPFLTKILNENTCLLLRFHILDIRYSSSFGNSFISLGKIWITNQNLIHIPCQNLLTFSKSIYFVKTSYAFSKSVYFPENLYTLVKFPYFLKIYILSQNLYTFKKMYRLSRNLDIMFSQNLYTFLIFRTRLKLS